MAGRRTDANHAAIRDALRRAGWYVLDTSRLGRGFPDLVAVRSGRVVFLEVKDGTKPPSARRLTPDEQVLLDRLRAERAEVAIVLSVEEALAVCHR